MPASRLPANCRPTIWLPLGDTNRRRLLASVPLNSKTLQADVKNVMAFPRCSDNPLRFSCDTATMTSSGLSTNLNWLKPPVPPWDSVAPLRRWNETLSRAAPVQPRTAATAPQRFASASSSADTEPHGECRVKADAVSASGKKPEDAASIESHWCRRHPPCARRCSGSYAKSPVTKFLADSDTSCQLSVSLISWFSSCRTSAGL
mmetsp:Transcript_54884/g.157831  ORF Transcript_54884/g.157831 Transcript_54884/m.157831 type:complete len:204 (+) Transcript_54884:461-1072(+)